MEGGTAGITIGPATVLKLVDEEMELVEGDPRTVLMSVLVGGIMAVRGVGVWCCSG